MPSLIARASSTFVQLSRDFGGQDRLPDDNSGRRKQRYYYSRSPNSTPTSPKDISPRSRPTESGSARASYRLRFAPAVFTLSRFLEPAGRQRDRRSWSTGKQSPFDQKLLNRSRQEILISVIFLCRSVHSGDRFPLSVERLPL